MGAAASFPGPFAGGGEVAAEGAYFGTMGMGGPATGALALEAVNAGGDEAILGSGALAGDCVAKSSFIAAANGEDVFAGAEVGVFGPETIDCTVFAGREAGDFPEGVVF